MKSAWPMIRAPLGHIKRNSKRASSSSIPRVTLDWFSEGRQELVLPSLGSSNVGSRQKVYKAGPTYLLGRSVGYVGKNDKHNPGRQRIPKRPQEEGREDLEAGIAGWPRQARIDQWPTNNIEAPGMREHPRSREVDIMSISTPRAPIVVNGNSTFCASFEYLTDSFGLMRPSIGSSEPFEEDEILPEDFQTPLVQSQFSFSTMPLHEFMNPSNELPMKATAFLSCLDLSAILPVIAEKYVDNDRHYRHDPQAMFKALILRRLLGLRWHTDLERYFQGHPDEARAIGFNNPNGRRIIPNHCTFTHFERRIGIDGMRTILDVLVMQIRTELKRMGIALGTNVAIDATPIEGKQNDPDTSFNPYYRKKGYKIHGSTT